MKYLRWNLIVPMLFLIGGGLWLKEAIALQQSEGLAAFMSRTGPGTFPSVVLTIMIVCSAIVTIQEFLNIRREDVPTGEKTPWSDYLRVVIMMLALLAYILCMPKAGFIPTTIILMIVSMLLFGEKNKILIVAVPVAATIFIYFIFTKFLFVPLPKGTLF